ncbi:MAG TPA: hypothetical protein VGP63_25505 [Planctomycetaceae bacterium]|nr:hypothetical protein [Planctomycetaceae bacterium]
MSKNMSRVVPFLGALGLLTQAASANAQGWFPPNNACCNPCPTCCAAPVTCMQPVSVPCYRQVPVTHYEPYEQTVMKPICRTEYIEQPVTVCRPVVEQRTAEVPECTYHPVTEFYPQTRDMGGYQTFCRCCPRMSPCQYDPNPGLFGWMNRTGYEMRMAFTPQMTYERRWVPNVITTQVPVTRQVAVQSVRRVTYNVTRMQTEIEHRRVAINRVDMVPEKVVMHRPVTVITQVPIGTSVAWIPAGSLAGGSSTATALGPTPDPAFRSARREREKEAFKDGVRTGKVIEKEKQFKREQEDDFRQADPLGGPRSEVVPQRRANDVSPPSQVSQREPSAVTVGGWMAHRQSESTNVQTGYRGVAVADTKQ